MEFQAGRYYSGLPPPAVAQPNTEIPHESVDLLQMVPEAGRPRQVSQQEATWRSTQGHVEQQPPPASQPTPTTRRMRVLLVQDEDEAEENDSVHVCESCREGVGVGSGGVGVGVGVVGGPGGVNDGSAAGSIYYSRREVLTNEQRNNETNDGSVYFNYLQFANKSRGTGTNAGSLYEPMSGLAAKRETSKPNFAFNCCKKSNLPPKEHPSKCNNSREDVTYSTSTSGGILHNNRAKRRTEWTRVKRLLFLIGILLGILIALGGIVVGFVVLAPNRNKDYCRANSVRCASRGCVPLEGVCHGYVTYCPTVVERYCYRNGTAKRPAPSDSARGSGPEEPQFITVMPSLEEPILDDTGWAVLRIRDMDISKYSIINRAMTFNAAQEDCRKRGGHLAHVNSIREQVFVEDFLRQELLDKSIADGIGFWMGARRARGSHSGTCLFDQWKWVDASGRSHGSIKGFTAFAPSKPDNYFSPEECLYISHRIGLDEASYLKWDDAPCDINSIGGIKALCEVDAIS